MKARWVGELCIVLAISISGCSDDESSSPNDGRPTDTPSKMDLLGKADGSSTTNRDGGTGGDGVMTEDLGPAPDQGDLGPTPDQAVIIDSSLPTDGGMPAVRRPYLSLVSFYTPQFKALETKHLDAINTSPYHGLAVALADYEGVQAIARQDFDDAVALIKSNATKHIWPWIFFNTFYAQPSSATQGVDLDNTAGALQVFYDQFTVALQIATDVGAPGIVVDPETYNDYTLYTLCSVATATGYTNDQTVAKLKDIGAHLADLANATYPAAQILSFFGDLHANYGCGYQRTTNYILLGMLEQAKTNSYGITVISGGEAQSETDYCSDSLAALQAKITSRQSGSSTLLGQYPNWMLGGTIAPWDTTRTGWLTQGTCAGGTMQSVNDFIPFFELLLQTYDHVWIYAAGVANYDPFNAVTAAPFNSALQTALDAVPQR